MGVGVATNELEAVMFRCHADYRRLSVVTNIRDLKFYYNAMDGVLEVENSTLIMYKKIRRPGSLAIR